MWWSVQAIYAALFYAGLVHVGERTHEMTRDSTTALRLHDFHAMGMTTPCGRKERRLECGHRAARSRSRSHLRPVLLDVEGPLELEVRLVVVVDEFGDGLVVSSADHARRGRLALDWEHVITISLDEQAEWANLHFFSYSGLSFVFGEYEPYNAHNQHKPNPHQADKQTNTKREGIYIQSSPASYS